MAAEKAAAAAQATPDYAAGLGTTAPIKVEYSAGQEYMVIGHYQNNFNAPLFSYNICYHFLKL